MFWLSDFDYQNFNNTELQNTFSKKNCSFCNFFTRRKLDDYHWICASSDVQIALNQSKFLCDERIISLTARDDSHQG